MDARVRLSEMSDADDSGFNFIGHKFYRGSFEFRVLNDTLRAEI